MQNLGADPAEVHRAADLIEQADGLIIAAGAGMGVDSGLPDFRGREGFWNAYPALRASQIDFYRIASPEAFRESPELAWGFYGHRLSLYRRTVPHRGFAIIKEWAESMPFGATVFTSNVDGHFQQAGFDGKTIHECHGSIHHLQCLGGCSREIWSADTFAPEVNEAECRLLNAPPLCPHCGGLARPNVMMFGDWEWIDRRALAQAAWQESWLADVQRPVVVELGAGSTIPSVRHFSHRIIRDFGGRLVRINPREAVVPTRRDVGLATSAVDGLTAMAAVLKS